MWRKDPRVSWKAEWLSAALKVLQPTLLQEQPPKDVPQRPKDLAVDHATKHHNESRLPHSGYHQLRTVGCEFRRHILFKPGFFFLKDKYILVQKKLKCTQRFFVLWVFHELFENSCVHGFQNGPN